MRNPLAKLAELDDQKRELLRYIVSYFIRHRIMPSVREMSASMGLSSANACMVHVKILVRKGYLRLPEQKYVPRSYQVVGLGIGPGEQEWKADSRLQKALGDGWCPSLSESR